ncbi:MAG: DUF2232 domain-containing protein [Granulosicoccus sp.]
MIALARVADRGPMTAAAVAAILLLAALWVPVLLLTAAGAGILVLLISTLSMLCLIASAAVVAFVALRHGEMAAVKVAGSCLLLLVLVSLILYGSALHIPLIAVIYWLPAIVAAFLLARTVRLEISIIAIVLFGLVAVVAFVMLVGNVTDFLQNQFLEATRLATEQSESGASMITDEQQQTIVERVAWVIPGAFGVSVMSIALGALFLARSWQAELFNPGGFQKEFHGLKLGRSVSLAAVLVIALAMMQGGQLSGAVAMVIIFGLFLQGLAVVHSLVKQRQMNRLWLHGMYIFVLLLPHTLLLLAALGLTDNLFNLRGKEG